MKIGYGASCLPCQENMMLRHFQRQRSTVGSVAHRDTSSLPLRLCSWQMHSSEHPCCKPGS
jgi:hypothetical protein